MVNGNFVLSPLTVELNVILPDTCPEPFVTFATNVGSLNVVPLESFIVKSLAPIAPLRFCWFIIINISSSVAVFDEADGKENTWESDVNIKDLAVLPVSPVLDLAKFIVFVKLTLALTAVKLIDPESWVIPVTVNELLELVAVTPDEFDPVNVKLEVTLVNPRKTIISVVPVEKSGTVPSAVAGNVWDSFVKNAVIASVPSAPGAPSDPSEPVAPPSNLKILVVSLTESLDTSIDKGSLVLSPPTVLLNVIEPLTWPVPDVTSVIKLGLVNVLPPESFIVILPVTTAESKFCWFIINNISSSMASLLDADGNENTWESVVNVINLAVEPGSPWLPCLDFANDNILLNDVLADTAVNVIDPESTVNPVTVIALLELVAVTPFVLDPVYV